MSVSISCWEYVISRLHITENIELRLSVKFSVIMLKHFSYLKSLNIGVNSRNVRGFSEDTHVASGDPILIRPPAKFL